MKKILRLIKRHIILFILSLLALVAFIIMLVVFIKMTVNTSSKYGNRLDGIDEVSISKNELKDREKELEEKDDVDKSSIRIQGRIIYFDITFSKDTNLSNAKKICDEIVSSFEEEELDFYDISFIITQNDLENDDKWVAAGYKNTTSSKISWNKS